MKILQIMTELGCGGAEQVVLDLSRGLVRRGHSVSLAVFKPVPKQNKTESFREIGIEPIVLDIESIRDLPRLGLLRAVLKEDAPDLIHSHLMHPNLLTRVANLWTGIPLVNTIHISERRDGQGIFFLADTLTSSRCACCTAVSNASARFHERATHLMEGTIRTIRNGVDPRPVPSREIIESAKERWNVSHCQKIFGCIGRLDQQKGFDSFLRVLTKLQNLVPAGELWGIVILGEGPMRKALEEQIENTGLRNLAVRLPGFEPDAASLAAAFDVFVMPSRYEGYGLAFAEALNFGLPSVYNPVDSLPELAEGISNAFPADFNDPEADEATAQTLVKAAGTPRTEPHTLWTCDQMTEAYLALYQEILDRKKQK